MVLDSFFNLIFGWSINISPLFGIGVVAFIFTLIVTLIYKYTTDQSFMKSVKEEMKDLQKQMKEHKEDHKKVMELQKVDLMDNYLNNIDWQVKENANMSYSLQGLNNYLSSEVSKSYWLSKIYTPEIKRAHQDGDFHIHDLNILSTYCVGWDLQDLLREGFRGAEGKIESKPPKHLKTALGQLVNFFYTLQGEAAGAEAVSNFDTLFMNDCF